MLVGRTKGAILQAAIRADKKPVVSQIQETGFIPYSPA
jgi:hypothetical protein